MGFCSRNPGSCAGGGKVGAEWRGGKGVKMLNIVGALSRSVSPAASPGRLRCCDLVGVGGAVHLGGGRLGASGGTLTHCGMGSGLLGSTCIPFGTFTLAPGGSWLGSSILPLP